MARAGCVHCEGLELLVAKVRQTEARQHADLHHTNRAFAALESICKRVCDKVKIKTSREVVECDEATIEETTQELCIHERMCLLEDSIDELISEPKAEVPDGQ